MKGEKLKQTKLECLVTRQLSKSEQIKIDNLIVNYIISEARPLQTVEEPSFLAMVYGLNQQAKIMGVKKLSRLIKMKRENFYSEVPKILSSVEHICLAIDMWSTLHRAFIGVTSTGLT